MHVETVSWDSVSDGGVAEYSEHVDDPTGAATANFGASVWGSLASLALAGTRRLGSRPFATCLRCTKELISRPASRLLLDKEAEDASLLIQKSGGKAAF